MGLAVPQAHYVVHNDVGVIVLSEVLQVVGEAGNRLAVAADARVEGQVEVKTVVERGDAVAAAL